MMKPVAAAGVFRVDVRQSVLSTTDAIEEPAIGKRIVGLRNFREVCQTLFEAGLSPEEAGALLIGIVVGKRATERGLRLLGQSVARL